MASLATGLLMASMQAFAQDSVDVRFYGPDRTHLLYHGAVPGDGAVRLVATHDGGGERQISYAEGAGALIQGSLRETGLATGTHRYEIQKCDRDPVTGELEPWYGVAGHDVSLDGVSAGGELRYDEDLEDVRIAGVSVPPNITLTLAGTLIAPTNDTAALSVEGALLLDGPVTLLPHVRGGGLDDIPFRVHLDVPTSLSGLTGGMFAMNAAGSSLRNSDGVHVVPGFGGELQSITNGVVYLWELRKGATLSISDSQFSSGTTPGYGYNGHECRDGTLLLDNVVWSSLFTATGAAEVEAENCDFRDRVEVDNDTASSDSVKFLATSSRFTSFAASRTGSGLVMLNQCLFSEQVAAYGGAAQFEDCEFGQGFRLQNRSATVITRCLFLDALVFASSVPGEDPDVPRWYEDTSPSPTIQGNAFMGDVALHYETLVGVSDLPSAPITIGANYFGSPGGWYNDATGLERGFLPQSYRARVRGNSGPTPAFNIDAPSSASPFSGTRQDRRVFPRFWLNGHVVGQNTINHQSGTLDSTASRILIKGRETLLAVDLSCTEESLAGVRVYAEWNGEEIDATPTVRQVRRDPARFPPNEIRYGRSTFSFVLPPVQEATLPVVVRLDASGVAGYDPASYPDEDAVLLSGTVVFKDPPERPLRIWVIPVEVSGVFGSWGTGNAADTVEALKREIPNQLAIPSDKLSVLEKPVLSVWSPPSTFRKPWLPVVSQGARTVRPCST